MDDANHDDLKDDAAAVAAISLACYVVPILDSIEISLDSIVEPRFRQLESQILCSCQLLKLAKKMKN